MTKEKIFEVPSTVNVASIYGFVSAELSEWGWIIAVCAVLGILAFTIYSRRSVEHTPSGTGVPARLNIDGRYEVAQIPKSTVLLMLKDIETGAISIYSINAEKILGGTERLASAKIFQAVSAHGGDLLQLCELEVIPEKEEPPKLRHHILRHFLWKKGSENPNTQPA